jgi:hypothetical protein
MANNRKKLDLTDAQKCTVLNVFLPEVNSLRNPLVAKMWNLVADEYSDIDRQIVARED